VASFAGEVTLPQVYVVAGCCAVLTVFFDVAYQSYLPVVVPPALLMDSNGKLGTTQSLARFVGPSLGGLLVSAFGAVRAVAVDVLSYVVSLATLLLIRVPEPEVPVDTKRSTFRAAMAQGPAFVLRHPILRNVVACSAMTSLFGGALEALNVVYLVRVLGAPTSMVGVVLSLAAVGGVAGGIVAARVARRIGTARATWLPIVACIPFYCCIPLAQPGPGLLLYSVGWAAYGFSSVIYNTAQVSYRQRVCPAEMLGRVTASIRFIVWGSLPLGALAGGALGSLIGVRPTLWLVVAGISTAPIWLLTSPIRKMRDLPAA
jgi:MFS family permease